MSRVSKINDISADTIATIRTAKGSTTGTIAACWAWQCEMQGAFARIEVEGLPEVSADDFDFDGEDVREEENFVAWLYATHVDKLTIEINEAGGDAVLIDADEVCAVMQTSTTDGSTWDAETTARAERIGEICGLKVADAEWFKRGVDRVFWR